MQNDDEEIDRIEHYLVNLRKKVDHQIKNPFEIHFANFRFEDITTWKNNVLQLDATSRLYGQRVDFLHCGALQILGTVLHSESNNKTKEDGRMMDRQQIKRQNSAENNPIGKHLQVPEKISNKMVSFQDNMIIWREVCKKRDTLSLLMLNDLPTNKELRLSLFGEQKEQCYYESQHAEEQSKVYLKLLNFQVLNSKMLQIFTDIESMNANLYTGLSLYKNNHIQRKTIPLQQYYQIDFNCEFPLNNPGIRLEWEEQFNNQFTFQNNLETNQIKSQVTSQTSECSSQDHESSYFQFQNWKDNPRSKKKNKKRSVRKERKEESVDFAGIHPLRCDIFTQFHYKEQQDRSLLPRDYLLLKFIKYTNPFPKKNHPKNNKSKFKPIHQYIDRTNNLNFETNINDQSIEHNQISYEYNSYEPVTANDTNTKVNISRRKFKEANLPIKEMKKKIRSELIFINPEGVLHFNLLKQTLTNEEPLDLFITLLHIAAEDQRFIEL